MSCRNHRIRDTDTSLNLLRRVWDWREEGEAAMLADGPYLSVIGRSTQPWPWAGIESRPFRGAVLRSVDNQSTPLGREAGVIPTQSRYGDRPLSTRSMRKSGRRPRGRCSPS